MPGVAQRRTLWAEAHCATGGNRVIGWDPFADSFRIVERFGGRFREGWLPEKEDAEDPAALVPHADIFEDAQGLIIEVELSGIAPEDVVVRVSDDTIIVEAERKFTRNGREVRQLESRYGRLRRQFLLPLRSLPAQAVAECRHGLLRIMVPRSRPTSSETSHLQPRAAERAQVVTVG